MFDNPKIAVIGLGYVGLPTALAFHKNGFYVNGLDINDEIIDKLRIGEIHLEDASHLLSVPNDSSRWSLTSDFNDIVDQCDIFLITVPTPTNEDKTPNLKYVNNAFEQILSRMEVGNQKIVVLESTVYPGVTEEISKRVGEKFGLEESVDFFTAYSPERVSPGEIGRSAEDVARIVGSNREDVGRYMAELYSQITLGGCKYVGEIKVAEAAKMVENTQRDIDLAFVNELAKVLPKVGINVEDVLEAASTKWNFHKHDPGIGVGGHCIPVDPYYYIQLCNNVGEAGKLSLTAREINESMPHFAAEEIGRMHDDLSEVLILGYSYKPEVGDVRETPVKHLVESLNSEGVNVRVWDPTISRKDRPDWIDFWEDAYLASEGVDAVVLATAHEQCIGLDWSKMSEIVGKQIIYDGRGRLEKSKLKERIFLMATQN